MEQYFSINELSENHVIYLRIEEILEKYYLVDEVNTEEPAINISKTENIIIWNITSPIYQKIGMAKQVVMNGSSLVNSLIRLKL